MKRVGILACCIALVAAADPARTFSPLLADGPGTAPLEGALFVGGLCGSPQP